MEKHHSCINTRAIIEYFQEHLPGEVDRLLVGLGPEIEQLPQPLDFLMEIHNWVSSDVVIKMFDNARNITQDPDVAFKIGFESAARKKLGYVQRVILLAYKNPRRSLIKVQKINDKFNRNKSIDIVKTTRDDAVIRLNWFKDIPSTVDFCKYGKGIYSGIPTIWNLPPAILEETKCYFHGDDYCEYHLRWTRRFSLKESLLNFLVPWRALRYTIEELEKDKELLKNKFDEVHRLNLELQGKIKQLLTLQEELSRYRDHLESLVEERTGELVEVNRQLQGEIEERQRTEQALRESEARFRTIFEGAPIGIGLGDLKGRFLEGNLALEKMLGYSLEELRRLECTQLSHADEVALRKPIFEEVVAGKRDFYEAEGRFCKKDGGLIWVWLHLSAIRGVDGQPLFVLAMLKDVTREKQVQEEIAAYQERLRSLASELSLTEERERRRLAADLHDHIGQILALAQIKMGALRQEATSPGALDAVGEIRDYIGQAIRYTRSLTFELGLPVLYDLGLEAAVEWLAEQFQEQSGIPIRVSRDSLPKPLGEASSVLVFRILRELLTNVVKHAQASQVDITVSRDGDHLSLLVSDNGIGFDTEEIAFQPRRSSGYGLFSIQERLSHLGGYLEVRSQPGQGTLVTLVVPLEEQTMLSNL